MNKIANMLFGEQVLGILALSSKNGGIESFFYDHIFYGIHYLTEKYPEAFPNIYFKYLIGGYPYCKKLENAFFRLGIWEGIYLNGRAYQYITVNISVMSDIENDIKLNYGYEKLAELIKMSKDFVDFIKPKQ